MRGLRIKMIVTHIVLRAGPHSGYSEYIVYVESLQRREPSRPKIYFYPTKKSSRFIPKHKFGVFLKERFFRKRAPISTTKEI
jgi:hypothetical protein